MINEIQKILQEINESKNDKKEYFPIEFKFNYNKDNKYIELIKYYISNGYSHIYSIKNALFIMDNNIDIKNENIIQMIQK